MIFMEPPKLGQWDGSTVLATRIIATDGTRELRAFAAKCGFDRPTITFLGFADEHIKVYGRRVVETVKANGAVQTRNAKAFRNMRAERRAAAKGAA